MTCSIEANVRDIRETIAGAARGSRRDPADIRLVAAAKTVSADRLQEAYEAGIRIFGENRLQEAQEKMRQFGPREDLEWHFIGRMQSRKLRAIVGQFCLLHSVESLEQARMIDDLAGTARICQNVLLQVNVGMEESKGGFSVEELQKVASDLDRLTHLNILGLMALPPWKEDPEDARPYFASLRQVRDELARQPFKRIQMKDLSMGMSHDYHVAVEEGATLVRIGTAIFGARA